ATPTRPSAGRGSCWTSSRRQAAPLSRWAAYFFSLRLRPPPCSTLFPYTTLFRSGDEGPVYLRDIWPSPAEIDQTIASSVDGEMRSEEHTSELQSLRHLVCRLLLEKKKGPNLQLLTPTEERLSSGISPRWPSPRSR